ncbi:hypothetical protein SCARD494_07849 [Seiridium cardinale]
MSTSLKKVAVVGASGNVGVPLVKELLSQGFTVTALTRTSSSSIFPPGVSVKKVDDFGSISSLAAALQGQDAVVSTIATMAVGDQNVLVDAAIAAGVKRFVPSEYGINTRTMGKEGIGAILSAKTKLGDYLIEKAAQNESFSWTGLSTGSFLDWSLDVGTYGINKTNKTATIYDSGNARFQVSNLPFIAKAITAILSRPEKTKNQYLSVASGYISQNEILRIAEQETGENWKIERVNTADLTAAGNAALEKGEYGQAFVPLLLAHFFSDGQSHSLTSEENANEALGLEEEDLSEAVKAWLREIQSSAGTGLQDQVPIS